VQSRPASLSARSAGRLSLAALRDQAAQDRRLRRRPLPTARAEAFAASRPGSPARGGPHPPFNPPSASRWRYSEGRRR